MFSLRVEFCYGGMLFYRYVVTARWLAVARMPCVAVMFMFFLVMFLCCYAAMLLCCFGLLLCLWCVLLCCYVYAMATLCFDAVILI